MARFHKKRRTDSKGNKRNNYYRKGRTKLTQGHWHDQIGDFAIMVFVVAILILGIQWIWNWVT